MRQLINRIGIAFGLLAACLLFIATYNGNLTSATEEAITVPTQPATGHSQKTTASTSPTATVGQSQAEPARKAIASSTSGNTMSQARLYHLLNRTSFGIAPKDLDAIRNQGSEAYIQAQLHPETLEESPQLQARLSSYTTLRMTPVELWVKFKQGAARLEKKERWARLNQPQNEAIVSGLLRATLSKRQLQEVMVDFWLNQLSISLRGLGQFRIWAGNYTENAIRPHALGRFRDLLEASARHPAMLVYLDNWLNTAPESPKAKGRFKGLNENYARELLELHTLGVDGGYNNEDVTALARILTGWGIAPGTAENSSAFYWDGDRHDKGDKQFLGHTIPGIGEEEVEMALDILARHPSTARHISTELARYFVADDPPASLVDRLATVFQQSDGDIAAVMDTLLHSEEFNDPQVYAQKFKTPYQYIVSLLRVAGSPDVEPKRLIGALGDLGMPPYGCFSPAGYPNTKEAWLSPEAILYRTQIAATLAHQKGFDRQTQTPQLLETVEDLLGEQTKALLQEVPPQHRAALILSSPEMMYR